MNDQGRKISLSRCLVLLNAVVLSWALSFGTPQPAPAEADTSWKAFYSNGKDALNVGNLTKAEVDFRKALSLVKSQSQNPEDTEECTLKLADVLALSYKTDEAYKLYSNLLNTVINRYGKYNTKAAPVLVALGSIEESQGNHDAAMEFYTRALHLYEKKLGPYSPAYAGTLHRLTVSAYKSGHKAEAAKRYKQARDLLLKKPGLAASKDLEGLVDDYGNLLIKGNDQSDQDLVKDFDRDILNNKNEKEADPPPPGQKTPSNTPDGNSSWNEQFKTLLQVSRENQTDMNTAIESRSLHRLGSDATLAPAYKVVSDTIFQQNHYEQSEANLKRMIAVDINALGPHHPSLANDLNSLAQLYIKQGKYAEAEPLVERALSIYKQLYGSNNLLVINTMVTLASIEYHLGYNDRAEQLYSSALGHGQQGLGPNSAETARILNELAGIYSRQGKLTESCKLYEMAAASTEAALGKDSPLLAACLKDYAQVLRSSGRDQDAEKAEARASGILLSGH